MLRVICCIIFATKIAGYRIQILESSLVSEEGTHIGERSISVHEKVEGYRIFDGAPPIILEFGLGSQQESFQSTTPSNSTDQPEFNMTFDPWSILWYIGSFGGLIAFFVVVSCSEWCCRKHEPDSEAQAGASPTPNPSVDAAPPDYELFAPPSYDSLCYGAENGEKREFEVFVVPVHTINTVIIQDPSIVSAQDFPPSYLTATVQEAGAEARNDTQASLDGR